MGLTTCTDYTTSEEGVYTLLPTEVAPRDFETEVLMTAPTDNNMNMAA